MITIKKRNKEKTKPKMVVDYNLGKASADLFDKMISYNSP
jgi:hypothetical protein